MLERLNIGDMVEVCYRGYVVSEHPFGRMVRVMIEDGSRGVQYCDAFTRHVRRLDDLAAEPILGPHSE